MSVNDELVQPSSDSFWEIGKYNRTVKRIDNGYKLCDQLRQLIEQRSEIERSYSKQLTAWSKKWGEFLDKGPEYGTTQGGWRGMLAEADSLSDLHTLVADNLMNKVYTSIKLWQKENYHKSMMHFKETKELEDGFKKAQKPWEKKYTKVMTAKRDYHSACKQEKSTANQENNARGDSAVSPDQLKKIQEKLRKCQTDVEATRDKYEASLNDLNSYNAKYIEDMNEVFSKCQEFEQSRIEFFKKTMYEIHQCVDLSVEPRFSNIFTTLHNTIGQIEPDHDLRWWSHNHGSDMAMNWPVFEEYSPDLQNITKKEKKSSQLGSDGITITSIRHKPEHMPVDYNTQQSRSSRTSQDSNPPPANVNNHQAPQVSRQKSYDEALNPFGCDEEEADDEEQEETSPSSNQPETSTITVPVESSNPFADEPDQADEDSSSTPRDEDETLPVTVRALYDYVKTEDDELSFKAGDVFMKLTDEDELGWCKGKKEGVLGLYPANYVEPV